MQLLKHKHASKIIFVIVAIFVLALAQGALKAPQKETSIAEVMAQLEKDVPAYAAIKTRAPGVYEELKTIIAAGIANNSSQAQIEMQTRALVISYVQKKIMSVSDDLVVKYTLVDLNVAKDLKNDAPEKCVSLITGAPTSGIAQTVKPETIKHSLTVLNEIVLAPDAATPITVYEPDATVNNQLFEIVNKNLTKHNIPASDAESVFAGKYNAKKSCEFLIDVTVDMMAMPTDVAANIIRNEISKKLHP